MDEQQHHEELIKGVAEQFKIILDKSPQSIYIYLDDTHKVCNRKLADLLGYKSPKEWAETEAPLADVMEEDQQTVINAYENASEKMIASNFAVRMKNVKTGNIINIKFIMVPIVSNGHIFVMHFLAKV